MLRRILSTLMILAFLILAQGGRGDAANYPGEASEPHTPAATITVSGTISGPGGPVSGVSVGVGSPLDYQEVQTEASGNYSLSLQTDGQVWINVRPDYAMGLSQINKYFSGVSGNFSQDFQLEYGSLLQVTLKGTAGNTITQQVQTQLMALEASYPQETWVQLDWDHASHTYSAMLPADVYYLTAMYPPEGFFDTTQIFNLRAGDLNANMPLNTSYVHPIPFDPPVASLIDIGAIDGLGEAIITGAAGAADPYSIVLLVNLETSHYTHTISTQDGSFSARLFAPPGSAIMVKHGPPSYRWNDLDVGIAEGMNPFPGTIMHVPFESATVEAAPNKLPFASTGPLEYYSDDSNLTLNYVSSAWTISGTLAHLVVDGEWTRVLTGTYNSETLPGLYLGGLNWTHPAFGDLDGDNDLDLLVGEEYGELMFYRNHGSTTVPDWRFERSGFAGVRTSGWAYPALADVNADGDPDLFVGSGSGQVSIYYTEAGAYPATPDNVLTAAGSASPALNDLDGDNDLDLLVGTDSGGMYLFENTGSPSSPAWSLSSTSFAGITLTGGLQPAFIDLDNDNDDDLLLGTCGSLIWYERGGTVSSPTWSLGAGDPIGFGGGSCGVSPGVGDWSGDGEPDIATGEHWGNLRYFLDNGASWSEQNFYYPFDLNGDSAPALGDWDGDDDLDLLVGMVHGNIEMYTNIGSPSAPDWRPDGPLLTLPWTNHPHPFPALADIDNDNDLDLFIGSGDWDTNDNGGTLWFYRNDGDSNSPNWVQISDNYLGVDTGDWNAPVFVDIDADTDLDLFCGDADGSIVFVENTGSPASPVWATPVKPYANLYVGAFSHPSFFDLDQDGDLDMLIGNESGNLAYVRNTGAANSPSWELVATAHPQINVGANAHPTAGDLTNDGLADMLIGEWGGGLNLYHYLGAGAPPSGGSTFQPGDLINVQAELRLYSPAIDAGTDPSSINAHGYVLLRNLFNADGDPISAQDYFQSTILTPTGFPVQHPQPPREWLNTDFFVNDLHYVEDHYLAGTVNLSFALPKDILSGVYIPVINWEIGGLPTDKTWLSAYVTRMTYSENEAPMAPITIGSVSQPHTIWRLMMDDFVQGTRGAGASEDKGRYALASQIVTQGAPLIIPPYDERTGEALTYRMEPFLPMISFTDRRMPAEPLIPLDLPGGELCATVHKPDGTSLALDCEAFAQSFNRTKTTRRGRDLNGGTVQLEDVYSLMPASDKYRISLNQFGKYEIDMSGSVQDVWGNTYTGGGTYQFWSAFPLDIDPGVLPGTPLASGQALNPAVTLHPGVPATISMTVSLYPDSDPALKQVQTISGQANRYGYFSYDGPPITLDGPGEYRFDLTASYQAANGILYMGALTWGGVVMTPPNQADLVAHGRRGLDSLQYIPNTWFVNSRDLTIPAGSVSHSLNPYENGDVYWSRMSDGAWGGDSLILGASVLDKIGLIEAAIQSRASREGAWLSPPGDLTERFSKGELPLFISNYSDHPVDTVLGDMSAPIDPDVDMIAYSYRSSQRPSVRVREVVAEDGQSGGYWRLDTLYDDQLGVGIQGDQPNDFKFQYVGTVYRDLESGHSEYGGQGSGWIFIPDSDPTGSRLMPPYSGTGNGGWTTEGGPLMTLKGKAIDMFILPTGVNAGSVLEVGDRFHFGGHFMPTLNSQVAITVTAPGGAIHTLGGQANQVGYFYNPSGDFNVDEPGLWTVDVHAWHDGLCSGGATVPPYPSGDVLGSQDGRFWFYVVPAGTPRLAIDNPHGGYLNFDNGLNPIVIQGRLPSGLSGVSLAYTIRMAGYILDQGQVTPVGDQFTISFDPQNLHDDFPNLDLFGRDDDARPGLSDTFSISMLAQDGSGTTFQANRLTLQGQQVYLFNPSEDLPNAVYLPLVIE